MTNVRQSQARFIEHHRNSWNLAQLGSATHHAVAFKPCAPQSISWHALAPTFEPGTWINWRVMMIELSKDHTFHYELLRLLGTARDLGADVAEVLNVAGRIKPGNFDSWST